VLKSDFPGGFKKLMHYGAVLRLQPAPFGGGQPLVRHTEGGDLAERLAHPIEPLLQASAKGPERRNAAVLGSDRGQRLGEKSPSLPLALRRAVGADQRQRLLALQPILFGRCEHRLLLRRLQGAQRVGQPYAHRARIHSPGHRLA